MVGNQQKKIKKKPFQLLKACEGMIHHEVWPIEAHPVGYYRNCFVVFFFAGNFRARNPQIMKETTRSPGDFPKT